MLEKPLCWLGSSLQDLRAFPEDARRAAGYQLGRLQQGLMPSDWKPMTTKIRRSSGNVFRDLGFPDEEAENLKIRTDLMIRLGKLIEARGLTQAQAAHLLGVTQPRVSDFVRGKIDRFSIDTLIAMLGHAGVRVQIVVGRTSKVA